MASLPRKTNIIGIMAANGNDDNYHNEQSKKARTEESLRSSDSPFVDGIHPTMAMTATPPRSKDDGIGKENSPKGRDIFGAAAVVAQKSAVKDNHQSHQSTVFFSKGDDRIELMETMGAKWRSKIEQEPSVTANEIDKLLQLKVSAANNKANCGVLKVILQATGNVMDDCQRLYGVLDDMKDCQRHYGLSGQLQGIVDNKNAAALAATALAKPDEKPDTSRHPTIRNGDNDNALTLFQKKLVSLKADLQEFHALFSSLQRDGLDRCDIYEEQVANMKSKAVSKAAALKKNE